MKRDILKVMTLALLGLALAASDSTVQLLMAQDVRITMILGTEHNLGARQPGESVGWKENISAGSGTIVVLSSVWRVRSELDVSCTDWMIISGGEGSFGEVGRESCETDRTGLELLEAAGNGESIAEHAMAVFSPKADGTAGWVSSFEAELARLSDDWVAPETPKASLSRGTYTIQQQSNGRYVDAHEAPDNDFRLVTRPRQDNATQRWILTPTGQGTYTIQQASTGRYVDGHEDDDHDFAMVTREKQNNTTQRWILTPVGDNIYAIRHVLNLRYVDAHEDSGHDYTLVTRTDQGNPTQRWIIKPYVPPPPPKEPPPGTLSGTFSIRQVSNGRYMDAHEGSNNDFRLVTRPSQDNSTQRWILTPRGGNTYTIQQASNRRYVDAHESLSYDYRLVTRPNQNNSTQRWILTPKGRDTYTIQQVSNGRYVDAHEDKGHDFSIVTRPKQDNTTQRWLIKSE